MDFATSKHYTLVIEMTRFYASEFRATPTKCSKHEHIEHGQGKVVSEHCSLSNVEMA